MHILYSLLTALAVLLSLPWWLFQMVRSKKYRAGLGERLGFVPHRIKANVQEDPIWIHAVSVGEVLAISNLVRELRAGYPEKPIFISTTTLTGQRLARELFGEDHVFFMPLDFGFAIRSYLKVLQPGLLVLAETEFWPNLLHLVKKSGASIAVVNGRISDRSFPRYRRFRWFFAPVLADIALFLAQTKEDAQRLYEMGADEQRVNVSGNLKFDVRPSAAIAITVDIRRALAKDAPVIVCGSTTTGEEEILLAAFNDVLKQHPKAVLILAPRHPERFDKIAGLVSASGLSLIRRSTWSASGGLAGRVFLLDSVGELASVYALADLAFVGGSLFPVGGHNILEPAQHGVAVLAGPHTHNFREITRIFEQGGGLKVIASQDLSREWLALIGDPQERGSLGNRAQQLFAQYTGATARTLEALRPFLTGPSLPRSPQGQKHD
ncbi:MAG TPA: 3-deoxy-D-manno-octulosonic acid transferase [Candidatus Angelobacter sp.]|jgi:3-deoxy-D-manno-octulosonic-acid transferase|nr:3-deoxy-D-manno-octulosonic acid transferase [Candidatus Angelobacter sp.]